MEGENMHWFEYREMCFIPVLHTVSEMRLSWSLPLLSLQFNDRNSDVLFARPPFSFRKVCTIRGELSSLSAHLPTLTIKTNWNHTEMRIDLYGFIFIVFCFFTFLNSYLH